MVKKAYTAKWVKEATKKDIIKVLGKYNRELAKAKKEDESFSLLEPRSFDDFRNWTDKQISDELSRMHSLFSSKQQTKIGNQKVNIGVKRELNALLKIGNERAMKRYDEFPEHPGTKQKLIEKERYAPIDLGDGNSARSLELRAKTIYNRTKEEFYEKGYKDSKWNVIKALNRLQGIESPLAARIEKINDYQFYLMQQNPQYGRYLQIEFIYDSNLDYDYRIDWVEKGLDALDGDGRF